MTAKEELHQLVDLLPDADAIDALDYVQGLLSDSDELSEEELELVRQGEAEIARGEFVTIDQLKRELRG